MAWQTSQRSATSCKAIKKAGSKPAIHQYVTGRDASARHNSAMKKTRTNGFTLVELLLVLTIAALLSLASLQGWQSWQQRQRMQETARQLQRFLHGVRAWANWHNREQPLWLLTGERWCLGSGAVPAAGCDSGRRLQLLAPHPQVHIIAIEGAPGFYGKRNVAKAGHIIFGEGSLRWRMIISSRGRIRLCQVAPCL
ncbi:prepilin-type N-terminal cleavage/methylation domain-containing protein [Pantoea alhagi]|nr:prepilin-type N-terminal cleavage/methylation domain-containing protein [Pantoea alhagi]